MDPEFIDEYNEIKQSILQNFADLAHIQPIESDSIQCLFENASDEQQLKQAGFKPVSDHDFLWIKRD